MTTPLNLEMLETSPGFFTVIVGDKFADMLARDEALGVVAAALFAGADRIPFLKSYEQWHAWNVKYRRHEKPAAPIALLTFGR